MEIPTTLKHKPVIVAEDYAHIDGRTAYHTDAQGLSLGLAQWNDRGRVDISAKVWRHAGKNGRAKARSCRCTACWILRFLCAGPAPAFPRSLPLSQALMIQPRPPSTVSAFRGTP